VFVAFADNAPQSLMRDGIPAGSGAIVRLGVIAAIGLGIAWWRLAHIWLAGASD
jgi:hypothetical protein